MRCRRAPSVYPVEDYEAWKRTSAKKIENAMGSREQELFSSHRILYVVNLWLVHGGANLMIAFTFYHKHYFLTHIFEN